MTAQCTCTVLHTLQVPLIHYKYSTDRQFFCEQSSISKYPRESAFGYLTIVSAPTPKKNEYRSLSSSIPMSHPLITLYFSAMG